MYSLSIMYIRSLVSSCTVSNSTMVIVVRNYVEPMVERGMVTNQLEPISFKLHFTLSFTYIVCSG